MSNADKTEATLSTSALNALVRLSEWSGPSMQGN